MNPARGGAPTKMARLAFSTVACPDWIITRVLDAAVDHGFEGVEFRSFGCGGGEFACEPGLTAGAKVRRMFEDRGIECAGLATGLRYDHEVFPPVLGHALPADDRSVRDTKPFIDLAVEVGAPTVRIFGHDLPERARAGRLAKRRMIDRLRYAADAAHHTGVLLLLENSGSLPRGADVAEVLDAVDSKDLAACYSIAPAANAGEAPEVGVAALGRRLAAARVKDLAGGKPCALGEGELPVAAFVGALGRSPAKWLVYEWDRAWVPGLAAADEALPRAAKFLYGLVNGGARVGSR